MTELSTTERATVERFEAAPDAEESAVERVARALFADSNPADIWDGDFPEFIRDRFRRFAAVAIAAMRPAPDVVVAAAGDQP